MTQLAFGTVAPTSRRAVAYIIDAAIAAGIGIVLSILLAIFAAIAGPDGMLSVITIGVPVVWLVLVGWLVFYTYMQSGKGSIGQGSIGMRAQGLRLVSESDGGALGFGRALLRNVIFWLAASIVVGYFTPLFDGSGRFQGWHDKVARSLMMDARTGGATVAAPPTQAMQVPPQPGVPHAGVPHAGVPHAVPPVPGLVTPAPQFAPPSQNPPSLNPPSPNPSPNQPTFPAAHGVPPVPGLPPAQPTPRSSSPESIAYAAPVDPAAQLGEAAPALDETIPAPPGLRVPEVPRSPQPTIARPSIAQPSAPATGEEPLIAFVPGITQDGPPVRSTPPPVTPAATPSPDIASDVDDVEDTRISIPGHRLVFTWDDGTRVTVSQRTLFGRNPAPEEGAVVVLVRDETLSLSKTHFEAAAEPSGGWIMDRHSTNGTTVVRDGERIICTPGEQVRIRLGDAIEIGDRIVTIGGYA